MTAATFLIANEIVLRRAIEAVGKLQVLEPGQRWQVVIQQEKTAIRKTVWKQQK